MKVKFYLKLLLTRKPELMTMGYSGLFAVIVARAILDC